MKKTLKVSALVIFSLIIVFTIIGSIIAIQSRSISGQNTTDIGNITGILSSLNTDVSNNARRIVNLEPEVSSNTNQISKLSNVVNGNSDQISKLSNVVNGNSDQISKLSESHKELQRVVWAHGAKTNRIIKAVFETAYGRSSETDKKVQKYTKDPFTNKGIWEQAILHLSETDAEKTINLLEMEEKILQNQQKLSNVKPRAFKR